MDHHTVLVTGGNGFLGQHLMRELQTRDETVKLIRVVDMEEFKQKLVYVADKPVERLVGDLRRVEDCRAAFRGVGCVFHCAALVSYRFPSNEDTLHQHNVEATRNVIQLCIEENVGSLVFVSTAEVTLRPYLKSFVALVVNQTEAKAVAPETTAALLIPGYPASKLEAEKLVLAANESPLSHGGTLKTVALRPTLMYGEEDRHTLLPALHWACLNDGKLPGLFGEQAKQQITYAGNVAWSLILARKKLAKQPKAIAGLPIFITDDTPIEDTWTHVQKATEHRVTRSTWWIPAIFLYAFAAMMDLLVLHVFSPLFKTSLPYSLRSAVSYLSSVLFFSRLRASLHLDYVPCYGEEEALARSKAYYKKQLNYGKCKWK